jgi:hypothetical protein
MVWVIAEKGLLVVEDRLRFFERNFVLTLVREAFPLVPIEG